MMPDFFAYLVSRADDGTFSGRVTQLPIAALPAGDVLIRVHYSSLNYKDGLAATGRPGVVRVYPHVPGIDAAGIIEESTDAALPPGLPVLVTGYDLGVGVWGGYATHIRVPAAWVIPLPAGLTPRTSMIYGTAGLTAALALDALLAHGLAPERGEVLVTGATGGVGSLAVALLAQLGFMVVAVTGKDAEHGYLRDLGASSVLQREDALDASPRPLLKGRWAGAIDTVGGPILASSLKAMAYGGVVAACGLAASADLPTTVLPFILRAVTLVGIDSVAVSHATRLALWERLAHPAPDGWMPAQLDAMTTEIGLADLPRSVEDILRGQVRGRVIVRPV